MPIPDQRYIDNLGDPNTGTNYLTYSTRNTLSQGTHIHYVQPDLSHLRTVICRVLNATTGEISVAFDDVNGHRNEIMNIAYNDSAKPAGTWHFPSDG